MVLVHSGHACGPRVPNSDSTPYFALSANGLSSTSKVPLAARRVARRGNDAALNLQPRTWCSLVDGMRLTMPHESGIEGAA